MSEFCRQCTVKHLGLDGDLNDFKGLSTPADTERTLYPLALCEGCGAIQVDHTGKCVSTDCLEGHGNCPLTVCVITDETREAGPCKFVVTDGAGDPDCGYG